MGFHWVAQVGSVAVLSDGIEVRVGQGPIYIARTSPDVVRIVHTLVGLRDSIPLAQMPIAPMDKLTAIYSAKQAAERIRDSVKGARFLVAIVGRGAAPKTAGGLFQNEVEIEAAHLVGVPVVVFGVSEDFYVLQGQPGGDLNEGLLKRLRNDKRVRFVELPATWDEMYECMRNELLRMLGGPIRVTTVETPLPNLELPRAATIVSGPPMDSPEPVSMGMLADRALDGAADDRLAFADYANGVWAVVDSMATQTPLVMALNAPWGAGKSSISRMVKERFDATRSENDAPQHRAMSFNAWQYDHDNGLTVSFVRQIAQFANQHRSTWQRLRRPFPLSLMDIHRRWRAIAVRFGWLFVAAPVLVWVLLATTGLGDLLIAGAVAVGISASIAVVGGLSKFALDGVAAFVRNPSAEAERGSMERVRQQLGALIAQARPNEQAKFVVLVDDLERCRPPHAVDILEVVSQLLDHRGVVVLLMGDMSIVAANVEVKYRELAERFVPEDRAGLVLEDRSKTFGNRYLQKIVQLQFDVPRLRPWRVAQFAEELAAGGPRVEQTQSAENSVPKRIGRLWRREPVRTLTRAGLMRRLVAGSAFTWGVMVILVSAGVLLERRIFAEWTFEVRFSIVMLAIAAAVIQAANLIAWRRDEALLENVDRALRDAQGRIANARGPPSKIAEEWKSMASDASTYFINQLSGLLFSKFTRKSEAFEQAYQAGLQYLPPYPRSVKRYLNRLRLLLFIAASRNLFAQGASPAHFGKWAALHERWPEFGRKLSLNPSDIAMLEKLVSSNDVRLATTLDGMSPGHGTDLFLREFLGSKPALGPVGDLLVHLDVSSAAPSAQALDVVRVLNG